MVKVEIPSKNVLLDGKTDNENKMMFGAYVLNTVDFESNVDFLKEAGIKTLIFNFPTPSNILQMAGENFEVLLEFQPFATGGVKDYFVENILGGHRDLGALGCPSNIELCMTNLSKLESRLAEVDVNGVALDFVRFPSPADGAFFYSCFCKSCSNAAKSLGYDISAFKNNIKQLLKKPEFELLDDWLDFKKEVILNYVKEFSERIKIKKNAFLFSPSLAPLVGQDYRSLSSFLDKIHPMLYPEGNLGAACLGFEIFHFTKLVPDMRLKEVYNYLGLKGHRYPLNIESLRTDGLPDETIADEAAKAVKQTGSKIFPAITVIDIDPARTKKRVGLASQASEGIFLFGFSPEYKENFQGLV